MKNKNNNKTILNAIIILLLIIMSISIYLLIDYKMSINEDEENFSNLRKQKEEIIATKEKIKLIKNGINKFKESELKKLAEKVNIKENTNPQKKVKEINERIKELKNEYPDLVAWISIESSLIDYPLMYSEEQEKYLHMSFDGKYSVSGTPFLDSNTPLMEFDKENPTINLIYGHNMRNGSMFASLHKYYDEDYLRKSPPILIEMEEDNYKYKPFAAVKVKAYTLESDIIFGRYSFKGKNDYTHFINFLINHENAIYLGESIPTYPDDIIILSTCSYHVKNGRLIVLAHRID